MGRRTVLSVRAVDGRRPGGYWLVESRPGSPARVTVAPLETKDAAVEVATAIGRALESAGGLAQVVIFERDGTIGEERTYGEDPPESPG